MDYEAFRKFADNASDDASDEDYSDYVRWLSERTATQLKNAKGNQDEVKAVLCRYWKRGYRAGLTPSELIDFLAVDYPSILDRAGFTDEEGDKVMVLSDALTEAEINEAVLI